MYSVIHDIRYVIAFSLKNGFYQDVGWQQDRPLGKKKNKKIR